MRKKKIPSLILICLFLVCIGFNNNPIFNTFILPKDEKITELSKDDLSTESIKLQPISYEVNWSLSIEDNIESRPAISDLNKDGYLEVLVGTYNGTLYCFNHTGGIVWNFHIGERIETGIVVTDLDDDGTMEIIFGSNNSTLTCLNHEGK